MSLKLVAGGRRLAALKRLQVTDLVHAKHFIWRDEEDEVRRRAAELEENLRRKDLSWQEEVVGKAKLLALLQQIHGVAAIGPPRQSEKQNTYGSGMSMTKLAAVLGENPSTTSKDLTLAEQMKVMPQLANCETKGAAMQKLKLLSTVVGIAVAAQVKRVENERIDAANLALGTLTTPAPDWTLYEGDFRDNISSILDESVDLVHTDLPYGADVTEMSAHSVGGLGFDDSWAALLDLIDAVADNAYRILRNDRYAFFWFGFRSYSRLVASLQRAGLFVVPVPIVWVKNTKSGENPNTRYSNSYEACLMAVKGSPVLMRPGASNVVMIPTVPAGTRTHVAEKPVDLVKRLIQDTVPPGAVIVDLMAGSGSTGVAALQHKCKVFLFEKEALLCRIIRDRLTVV
jgi:site-specific DNA-methyltransferase (adenine-specific)